MDKNISYYQAPITNVVPNQSVSLEDIYKGIKTNAHYAQITKEYRADLNDSSIGDEVTRTKKVSNFDTVTFSGTFSRRGNNNLIKHSGYICLDLDHIKDLESVKESMLRDNTIPTTMLFTSPSNDGLKWVVKIDITEVENHIKYFEALSNYIKTSYAQEVDPACKDVARACFLPSDPDVFFDPHAKCLDKNFIDLWGPEELEYHPTSGKVVLKSDSGPWDEYNDKADIGELLTNHGYTFVSSDGTGDRYLRPDHPGGSEYSLIVFRDTGMVHVHSSSCPNLTPGPKNKARVFCELEAGGDWKVAASKLIKLGYKGSTDVRKKLNIVSSNALPAEVPIFWDLDEKGKCGINEEYYLEFLGAALNIFKIQFMSSNDYELVQANGRFIKRIKHDDIEPQVINYLRKHVKRYNSGLYSTIFKSYHKFIQGLKEHKYYRMLDHKKVNLLKDTRDTCYLYFKNGILEITKDNLNFVDYETHDSYVWEEDVIDWDYTGITNYKNKPYYDFLWRVSGENEARLNSLRSAFGYIIHSHKDPATAKAVILIDEFLSENLDRAQGGTGKSIAAQSLTFFRKSKQLAGKGFNPRQNFAFSGIEYGDKIVWVDDALRKLDVDSLYNAISTDFKVERKGIDYFMIPFHDSPKIILTTNFPIQGSGGSDDRRQLVIEFASYFSKDRTVRDVYGQSFFDDWEDDDWKAFSSCMIESVQYYLKEGTSQVLINYTKKRVIDEIGPELLEYFEEIIEPGRFYGSTALLHGKKAIDGFDGFRYLYPEYQLNRKSLAPRLESYCAWKGYEVTRKRIDNMRGFTVESK